MKTAREYDVVVVGSGPGGGAAAWALTHRGLNVLLLEAGPRYQPYTDYQLHRPTWERSRFPEQLESSNRQTHAQLQLLDKKHRGLRSWNRVQGLMNPGDRRAFWSYSHVVGLGGSTLHFTGEAHRLHPAAMKMASRFGVAADWPIDYSELEPYYCVAEKVIGVSGPSNTGARFRSEPYPLAAHPPSYASQRLFQTSQSLGLGWEANPLAVLSSPYDGRPSCNYCANCNRGCPRKDKGSVDVTFIDKASKTGNLDILTRCQVTHLHAGNNDQVSSIEYRDEQGLAHTIATRTLIVACGAVETPRLLLNSTAKDAAEGIANESGQVGQHFMETIDWRSTGLFPEPLGSHRGLPSDSVCWDYNAPDAIPDVIGGCRFSPGIAEADLVGPINYARRVVPGWGREHKQRMRSSFGRLLSVHGMAESLPNPGSYIDLDPDAVDEYGSPKARIHSHLAEAEIKRIAFIASKCRDILQTAGIEQLVEEYGTYDAFNSTHVFGTCRMGNDPDSSVVDGYCRSHRWKNLYVVDASVFPSSGGGESPSLTIEALAIRSADHIVRAMKRKAL